MKKWMLYIALATPWMRRLWLILETININPAMVQDPIMGIKILIIECICILVILAAVLAAIHQRAEEKELLEARREIRRLKRK